MTPSIRSRGYLPHWECDHAIYFVTFRLADSLSQELLARLRQERAMLERARSAAFHAASSSPLASVADQARERKLRAILQKSERGLDDGLGHCYMRNSLIAKILADPLRQSHSQS